MRAALLLLLFALPSCLSAKPAKTTKPPKVTMTVVRSAKEAKQIAEHETRGTAVSAKEIYLNGATGGWEVDVRMPDEDRGWRCIIDKDTHAIYSKTRIPNPEVATKKSDKKPKSDATADKKTGTTKRKKGSRA